MMTTMMIVLIVKQQLPNQLESRRMIEADKEGHVECRHPSPEPGHVPVLLLNAGGELALLHADEGQVHQDLGKDLHQGDGYLLLHVRTEAGVEARTEVEAFVGVALHQDADVHPFMLRFPLEGLVVDAGVVALLPVIVVVDLR